MLDFLFTMFKKVNYLFIRFVKGIFHEITFVNGCVP